MAPSSVNLKAFESRLRTTFSHISRSTATGSSSGGQSTVKVRPALSIVDRKTLAMSAVSVPRSTGSWCACRRPASMREKSSRVLTSFSRRWLFRLRDLEVLAGFGRQPVGGQRLLERAQHERQRRAELVAHVREERGLGAIELGQRLGPLPIVLGGARVADQAADLGGEQLEPAAVLGVERAPRADAQHDRADVAAEAAIGERQHHRRRRRLGPRSGRHDADPLGQAGDELGGAGLRHAGDRPDRVDRRRRRRAPRHRRRRPRSMRPGARRRPVAGR